VVAFAETSISYPTIKLGTNRQMVVDILYC